jgi:hypothetical protein
MIGGMSVETQGCTWVSTGSRCARMRARSDIHHGDEAGPRRLCITESPLKDFQRYGLLRGAVNRPELLKLLGGAELPALNWLSIAMRGLVDSLAYQARMLRTWIPLGRSVCLGKQQAELSSAGAVPPVSRCRPADGRISRQSFPSRRPDRYTMAWMVESVS